MELKKKKPNRKEEKEAKNRLQYQQRGRCREIRQRANNK